MKKLVLLLLLNLYLSGCIGVVLLYNYQSQQHKLESRYDDVKNRKQYIQKLIFNPFYSKAPVYKNITFIKTISSIDTSYEVFDIMKMGNSVFKMEEYVYIKTDLNVNKIKISLFKNENHRSIEEESSRIMLADSSYKNVVTGYSTNDYQLKKMQYKLKADICSEIVESETLTLRYYAGPSIYDFNFSKKYLDKLKNLIISE